MLGKSNGNKDTQTSGVLIQYMRDISAYLKERKMTKKAVTLAVAVLMLAGLLGVHYKEQGTILPTSSNASKKELPIYCVQTDEPKIALTFDAAWGEGILMEAVEGLKILE